MTFNKITKNILTVANNKLLPHADLVGRSLHETPKKLQYKRRRPDSTWGGEYTVATGYITVALPWNDMQLHISK